MLPKFLRDLTGYRLLAVRQMRFTTFEILISANWLPPGPSFSPPLLYPRLLSLFELRKSRNYHSSSSPYIVWCHRLSGDSGQASAEIGLAYASTGAFSERGCTVCEQLQIVALILKLQSISLAGNPCRHQVKISSHSNCSSVPEPNQG